jgi:hypothetical protein
MRLIYFNSTLSEQNIRYNSKYIYDILEQFNKLRDVIATYINYILKTDGVIL